MTNIGSNLMRQTVTIARQSDTKNEHGTLTFKTPKTSIANFTTKKQWVISNDHWSARMEASILLPADTEITEGDMVTLGDEEQGRPVKDRSPVYDGQGNIIAIEVLL